MPELDETIATGHDQEPTSQEDLAEVAVAEEAADETAVEMAEEVAEEQPEAHTAAEAPGEEAAAPTDDAANPEHANMNWYIIHTYSGFENKVAESLRSRADAFGFGHRLGQLLIPKEQVVEMKNGKKVTSDRMLYPGYVMIQMEMDDQLWHEVKNTPRVTGFVGGGNTPVPLTADEVNKVLFRQTKTGDVPRPKVNYEKNETVRIVDGPFNNFSGKVDEVNHERNTLRVMVTIFGRSTPVELDFLQVEKV